MTELSAPHPGAAPTPNPSTPLADSLTEGVIEFGLHTFGDVTQDAAGTRVLDHPEVLRNLVSEGVLADQVGVDVIGIGEHHRPDYSVSAPDVVLAAIGAQTERIKLISAVTVLSSDDPVRVYQRFATLDGITSGRAEVSLGRGSFIESFPLFGYDLNDYEVLFEEKLELFDHVRREEPVTWSGTTRGALERQSIFPTTAHEDGVPTWVAVGGSPESAIRAARYGMGLELAIIGGAPQRFAPFADLYRKQIEANGFAPRRVAVHSHGFVANTDEEAMERYYPYWHNAISTLGRERGWPAPSPEQFAQEVRHGALHLGGPETVARKIANTVKSLGATRFGMKYGNGRLPHEYMMESIELYGTRVKPLVLDMLSES
ncbi:LLM class flavin-dependent oxidoreductase [Citricoccus muralis]|uniref:LLM class flavin-dependent oxidoreductase n=1 Tax=Citricoccus muralis TaxID=169134 RepID=A0ABY8H638_9MICC|nr:LLM class flavin-dependent oxidoreductase [Citricoccus muralis]WFP16471.1 LLM class flavin-dependent oxidoreductase [Citricoccus muralis]